MARRVAKHKPGDYLCRCGKFGVKQPLRALCTSCFNAEKRVYQNRWNQAKAEERAADLLAAKRNAWDTTLATRFTGMSLRAGA